MIVLRVAGLAADEQWAHLAPVVEQLARLKDPYVMTSHAVEVAGVGKFRRYPLPPD